MMATEAQLERALRNAHKAGDVQAAKRLAGAIIEMRGRGMQEPSGPVSGFGAGFVPFVDDEGMRMPAPRVGFDPGVTRIGAPPPEALQIAGIGAAAGRPDEAKEYARSTGQAMKEATATLPLLPIGGSVLRAPSMVGKIGWGAAVGAPSAGLYGTATGEGGVQKRLERGAEFGAYGAGLGAAGAPVISIGTNTAKVIGNRFSALTGGPSVAQRKAAQHLARTMMEENPGLSMEQALGIVERVTARYGPDAMMMDAGRRMAQLGADIARPGGEAATIVDKAVLERQVGKLTPSGRTRGGQTERVGRILDEASGGVESGTAQTRSIKAQQRAASDPIYKQTANNPGNIVSGPKFDAASADPYVAQQIAKVKGSKLHGLADLPDNSLPVIDATQKRMSDAASKAYRKGANHEGNLISEKRRALVEAADEAFPDYAKAREVWRDFKGVMDADDLGRKFMRGDVDVLEDAVARMSADELKQFRAGAVRALREIANKTKRGGDVTNALLGSENLEARARIALGENFRRYRSLLTAEGVKYRAFSETFRGSQTAERQARLAEYGIDPEELLGAAFDAKAGNMFGLFRRAQRILSSKNKNFSPEVRKEIARLITTRDFDKLRRLLGANTPSPKIPSGSGGAAAPSVSSSSSPPPVSPPPQTNALSGAAGAPVKKNALSEAIESFTPPRETPGPVSQAPTQAPVKRGTATSPDDIKPLPRTGGPLQSEVTYMVPVRQLEIDPKTYQFKAGGDEEGVLPRLRGAKKWDPAKAKAIIVHERRDGKLYVADGHQRTGLARRMMAADQSQNIEIPALIYREADGYSPADVRALAAAANIAEGSGSSLDAAKVLRERPELLESLSMTDDFVTRANELTNLSDDAFYMVINDVVPERYAALVGKLVKDESKHVAVMNELHRAAPDNLTQAESIVRGSMMGGFVTETQNTLFGAQDFTRSLLKERAVILDRALKRLGQDKRWFGNAVKGEERLAAAGNVMARDANQREALLAAQARDILQKLAHSTGPISDALTAAARKYRETGRSDGPVREFVELVRQRIASGDLTGEGARTQLGAARFGDEAAGRTGGPEEPGLF